MSTFTYAARKFLVVGAVTCGMVAAGSAAAGADPADYARLPVDPNVITDSTAYVGEPAVVNPDGQTGVEQVFTHRDSTRHITDTVLVLADPQAAGAALQQLQADPGAGVAGVTTTSVPVGDGGTVLTGTTPDGSQAISVLLFTRANTATRTEFVGGRADPVPLDLVVEYGQRQDDAIRQQLNL